MDMGNFYIINTKVFWNNRFSKSKMVEMICPCGKEYDFTGSPLISATYDSKGNIIAWQCIHGKSKEEILKTNQGGHK